MTETKTNVLERWFGSRARPLSAGTLVAAAVFGGACAGSSEGPGDLGGESEVRTADSQGTGTPAPRVDTPVEAGQEGSALWTALRSLEDPPLSGTEVPRDWVVLEDRLSWAVEQRLDTLPIGSTMAAIGRTFVGEPYTPHTLEADGPERLVVNLREFDCVTYVESVLALATLVHALPDGARTGAGLPSRDDLARQYRAVLANIRYRAGRLDGYPSRLHYFSEWLTDNEARGRLKLVTRDLGGVLDPSPIDFMSTHRDAYRQLADPGYHAVIERIESELSLAPRVYIPERAIAAAAPEIRDGDIIAATSTVDGLDIAHTGLALWVDGRLHMMHAPLVGASVEISEVPLADRIQRISGQDGIMVARPLAPALPGSSRSDGL